MSDHMTAEQCVLNLLQVMPMSSSELLSILQARGLASSRRQLCDALQSLTNAGKVRSVVRTNMADPFWYEVA